MDIPPKKLQLHLIGSLASVNIIIMNAGGMVENDQCSSLLSSEQNLFVVLGLMSNCYNARYWPHARDPTSPGKLPLPVCISDSSNLVPFGNQQKKTFSCNFYWLKLDFSHKTSALAAVPHLPVCPCRRTFQNLIFGYFLIIIVRCTCTCHISLEICLI